MIAFMLRHWKIVGIGLLVVALGGYAAWEHHIAASARADLSAYRQAEHEATLKANAAQARSDARHKAQLLALRKARDAATEQLEAEQAARQRKSERFHAKLNNVYQHNAQARTWRDTPIPASVRAALSAGEGPK